MLDLGERAFESKLESDWVEGGGKQQLPVTGSQSPWRVGVGTASAYMHTGTGDIVPPLPGPPVSRQAPVSQYIGIGFSDLDYIYKPMSTVTLNFHIGLKKIHTPG